MKELNKAQVTALFEREAVLMGSEDMVPEFRVAAASFHNVQMLRQEAQV